MNLFDRLAFSLGYTKTQAITSPPAWLVAEGVSEQFNIPDRYLPEAQLELYQRLSWVQIAVDKVASMAAVGTLGVMQLQGEKKRKVENHPLELLLQNPNPLDDQYQFIYGTVADYALTGNCYWWLNRASETAAPDEIWVLPCHKVKPVPDGRMYLSGYMFESDNGEQVPLDLHEVVHFKRYHPLNKFVGLSPIESLAITATADMNSEKFDANYFDKGYAKPQGALAFSDPIPADQWEQVKKDIKEKHGGTKREMMMLRGVGAGGVQWVQMALSQNDMQFLEGRTFNKEKIFAVYAPGLASMLAVNATEANSIAGKKTFTELAVWPTMVALHKKIAKDVLPVYGKKLVCEFEDIRITDRAMQLSEQNAFASVHTIDEVRERFYEAQPIGDDRGKLLIAEIGKGMTDASEPPSKEEQMEMQRQQLEAQRNQQAQPGNEEKPQTEGQPESDEPDEELTKAARKAASIKAHTSVMVAFFMPPAAVAELAQLQRYLPIASSPVPAGELHMTLLLLGDIAAMESARPTIERALQTFAASMPPITGRMNGIGRFQNVEPAGGVDAVYVSFDAKELPEWRQGLVAALREVGVETPSEHGFTPHITLGYIPSDAPTPWLYLPTTEYEFDYLCLAWGDARLSWRLMDSTPDEYARDEEVKRFRKWLKKRQDADVTKFKSDILSDADLVAIAAQIKGGGDDQGFFTQTGKATRNRLPGEDGNDEKRKELESYHADKLHAALRKIMRAVAPAGTTVENITPDSAWARYQENEKLLRDAIVEMLMDGAQLGADTGIAQVEAILGVGKAVSIGGVNWDLVNEAVLQWVLGSTGGGFGTGYGDTILEAMAVSSERQIRLHIAEWIRNDLNYTNLISNLQRTVFSQNRAQNLAITEISRSYAEGTRAAYRQSGTIRKLRWQSSNDELTCKFCGHLNGKIIDIEGSFDSTLTDELRNDLQGRAFQIPPCHSRCRCWITGVPD